MHIIIAIAIKIKYVMISGLKGSGLGQPCYTCTTTSLISILYSWFDNPVHCDQNVLDLYSVFMYGLITILVLRLFCTHGTEPSS